MHFSFKVKGFIIYNLNALTKDFIFIMRSRLYMVYAIAHASHVSDTVKNVPYYIFKFKIRYIIINILELVRCV